MRKTGASIPALALLGAGMTLQVPDALALERVMAASTRITTTLGTDYLPSSRLAARLTQGGVVYRSLMIADCGSYLARPGRGCAASGGPAWLRAIKC